MVVPITPSSSSGWSRAQDKIFERALVVFPDDTPHRWEKIAAEVPGKSPSDVREHYEILLHDVSEIDSGRVELTSYADNSFEPNWGEASTRPSIAQISFASVSGSKMTRAAGETERKKGVPWTAEEHRDMEKEIGGAFLEMQWSQEHLHRWLAMLRSTTFVSTLLRRRRRDQASMT